jgi:hypothetical protein
MKYFTKAMWAGSEEPGAQSGAVSLSWEGRLKEYRQQAEGLRDRVPAKAFEFFLNAATHDGRLRSFSIVQEKDEPWEGSAETQYPVRVELVLVEQSGTVWRVNYSGVRRVVVDHPSCEPLFIIGGEGFGDWGYDEFTDAGDNFLRHAVLFATGATLLVEFRNVDASSTSLDPGAA